MKKLILTLVLLSSLTGTAFAAEPDPESSNFQLVPECANGVQGPTVQGTNVSSECGWEDLVQLATNIMYFIVWIAGILAVMAFCYAGFLYMTAFGNMGKVEEAHKIFGSAIVGVFFVLCGWLIVATILRVMVGKSSDETDIGTIIDFKGVDTIQGQ